MSQLSLSGFTGADYTRSILLADMGSNHNYLSETSSETLLVVEATHVCTPSLSAGTALTIRSEKEIVGLTRNLV